MPIIEQRDIVEMMVRNHQALAKLRIVSDALAGHPCDAKTIMAALGVVRVNGERAGRQARRMLRAYEAGDPPSYREVHGILRSGAS